MPDIASVLKQEITRLARKEVAATARQQSKQIQSLKAATRNLRDQVATLEKTVSRVSWEISRASQPQAEHAQARPASHCLVHRRTSATPSFNPPPTALCPPGPAKQGTCHVLSVIARKNELIRPARSPPTADGRTLAIEARARLRGETPRL